MNCWIYISSCFSDFCVVILGFCVCFTCVSSCSVIHLFCEVIFFVGYIFFPVPCERNRQTLVVKRVNRYDESTDMYTEFFKPYELTSFDDTFCVAMTNSARLAQLTNAGFFSPLYFLSSVKIASQFIITVFQHVWFVSGSSCRRLSGWTPALSPYANLRRPASPCWGKIILH